MRNVDFGYSTTSEVQLYELRIVCEVYISNLRILEVDELQLWVFLHVDVAQFVQSVCAELLYQWALCYINVLNVLIHRYIEVQQVGLIGNVDGLQFVEVHINILHLVVLCQVYCRNLIVCCIARIALAVQICNVAVYLHCCSFGCSVDGCPRLLGGVLLQFAISPVDCYRCVVVVCSYGIGALLTCWNGERYAAFVFLTFEYRLYIGICSNGEQGVLHKCSIHHDTLVFLAFLGSVAYAQY